MQFSNLDITAVDSILKQIFLDYQKNFFFINFQNDKIGSIAVELCGSDPTISHHTIFGIANLLFRSGKQNISPISLSINNQFPCLYPFQNAFNNSLMLLTAVINQFLIYCSLGGFIMNKVHKYIQSVFLFSGTCCQNAEYLVNYKLLVKRGKSLLMIHFDFEKSIFLLCGSKNEKKLKKRNSVQ